MDKLRPVKRLIHERKTGSGKAEVATKKRFKHILWMASRGSLGKRNVAIIWMLFGSGLRVNEVAKLTVSDLVRSTGEIKTTFTIPSSYTKTGKSRTAYILAKAHREAIAAWIGQRTTECVFVAESADYGGLRPDSPMFAVTKKGKSWRTMAFRDKKYKDAEGNVCTTKVCGSMQNLISEIFKSSGLHHGSTHSGRRTLATWLDRKGVELETIQKILGHDTADMTLEYIEPDFEKVSRAFESTLSGVAFTNFQAK